ncbi:MAG: hypothetical protein U0992_09590 [Planctomycetaceae bacterium]
MEQPTIESADQIFQHRGVKMLCVTGGPAVARAVLARGKKSVVAGLCNPPVVVDETADIENAARCIVQVSPPTTTTCSASAKSRSSRCNQSTTS